MSSNPQTTPMMTGADLTAAALVQEGVTHVFGLPGTTVMHLIDAFARNDRMRFISVRHEQVAAFMADGYARATGEVGVCMASRGPGAANLAIGIHNAHAEHVPVLALVGQVPDSIYYRESFEELDLTNFFSPMTKWQVEIRQTERIPELLQRAVRTSSVGRRGAVLVSIPLDVQTAKSAPTLQPQLRVGHPAPAPDDVRRALDLLQTATRPVAIVGGGLQQQGYDAAVIDLLEHLQIPVVSTWMRKSVFPNDSDLFCGSLGYGAFAVTEELVRDADVVLALGCRFSEFATKNWTILNPDMSLIHVDLAEEVIGRVYPAAVGINADAHLFAESALSVIGMESIEQGRRTHTMCMRERYLEESETTVIPADKPGVPSAAIIHALGEILEEIDPVIVQDAPSLGTWIQRYLNFIRPARFYAAAGGSMGWGLPAAMGIQLARPSDRVLAVCGDGSFWMVAQDLETAVREDIPVVVLVNNNFAYGNTRDRQRLAHGERYSGVFYKNPDFAAYANLLGAHGERVETSDELLPALRRAFESGRPAIVDVIQNVQEGIPADLVPPPAVTG
ncbi:thiamine pyrophosphate-binding protein [Bacillus subtilis]|nr:thiamine pyrophosphate-binding protein [Bacillus subtilis]